ncbi:MAG: hypothetical protein FWH11_01670 [Micrococcales bacterium]|nr:hypothetical protein [Micrococcales bacterium]
MAVMTVRNIPAEVHRALRIRAAENGRSTEAEVRTILADAVRPRAEVPLGDALAEIGRRIGLTDDEADGVVGLRQRVEHQPVSFE